jgi:DNA-binding YbaB/EbfC family protein
MKDIMGMMKAAGEMKAKMDALQDELAEMVIEGKAGGGLVTVSLSGKGEMKGVRIDPSLFKEDDIEVIEDLIVAAHNDAKGKAETAMQEKMSEVTSGLPIPPGMKFPF